MLNGSNVLRFDGAFRQTPVSLVALDRGPIIFNADAYKDIDLTAYMASTYEIDYIEIVGKSTNDPITVAMPIVTSDHEITAYKPTVYESYSSYSIQFRFYDKLGNRSNIANIYLNAATRPLGYEGYLPSYHCVLTGGGQNTGQAMYGQLQRTYTDTNTRVLPLTLSNNVFGGPGYIAPTTNLGMCPTGPFQLAPFEIINNSHLNVTDLYTVSNVRIVRASVPDINYPVNVTPGNRQTVNIPVGSIITIEVTMSAISGTPVGNATMWRVSNGTGGFINISGTISNSPSFVVNVTTPITYPAQGSQFSMT